RQYHHVFSSVMQPRPPPSSLFPYTTLFRSPGTLRERGDRTEQGTCPAYRRAQGRDRGLGRPGRGRRPARRRRGPHRRRVRCTHPDRKSTRLNSSHVKNSYAVFCLKKKKTTD